MFAISEEIWGFRGIFEKSAGPGVPGLFGGFRGWGDDFGGWGVCIVRGFGILGFVMPGFWGVCIPWGVRIWGVGFSGSRGYSGVVPGCFEEVGGWLPGELGSGVWNFRG